MQHGDPSGSATDSLAMIAEDDPHEPTLDEQLQSELQHRVPNPWSIMYILDQDKGGISAGVRQSVFHSACCRGEYSVLEHLLRHGRITPAMLHEEYRQANWTTRWFLLTTANPSFSTMCAYLTYLVVIVHTLLLLVYLYT